MVNSRSKADFRGLERVICGEVNIQEENATGIRRVIRTHNSSLPVKQIISIGSCRAVGGRISGQFRKFSLNSLQSHLQFEKKKVEKNIPGACKQEQG